MALSFDVKTKGGDRLRDHFRMLARQFPDTRREPEDDSARREELIRDRRAGGERIR